MLLGTALSCPGRAGQLQQLRDDVRGDSSNDRPQREDDDHYCDDGCDSCGGGPCRHGHNEPFAGFLFSGFLGSLFFDDYYNHCRYRRQNMTPPDGEPRPDTLGADDPLRTQSLPGRVVGTAGRIVTSPFWVPRLAVDDHGATDVAFARYPYEDGRGYMLLDRWTDGLRFLSVRLRGDYAEDFEDLSRISGHLLVSTTSRWEFDTETTC
ncbi:MAG TPA: hypothetical protein VJL29_04595, partial [Thermoguttaceae bacterium]|nr:hypothetical protein [Thermoguttaceae bacterium]